MYCQPTRATNCDKGRTPMFGLASWDNKVLQRHRANVIGWRCGLTKFYRLSVGHLPMGQSSWGSQALTLVKQPQIWQRTPVWCSHMAQVRRRFCWVAEETVLRPEPMNRPTDLTAVRAMRSKPGPLLGGPEAGAEPGNISGVRTDPPNGPAA